VTFPLDAVIGSIDDLRRHYRSPSALVRGKKRGELDPVSTALLAACPFVLLATSDDTGHCDVSPRGGPPGFVRVLDEHHVALPDLNGNNLLDSLENIVVNPHAGLLCVVPGRDETLRIDGRAWVSASSSLLDRWHGELRRPTTAVVIEIGHVFVHCAKSFRRGRVWDPSSWAELLAPDAVEILKCQLSLDSDVVSLRAAFEEGYATDLARDRPGPSDDDAT
jgi:PPOX class probable FMN-dependent enzyme